ncbi:carbamoylphosphate synthase [Salpingoeca rosetta]|uniref:Carbamoyl phosphate synthase arginine-specific large chain n=1 Tax=Salpingoeca rosetta (strain ATCC 50818 / BSB-021) TaxID=946362 RepID=F2U457_SALR5|nr:carbamoylphosphate synthase [Salpingoeca rosetta]EGD82423.1 carbamoylphosphate synthase [Salpingoeca rosetta]|eukprot:XP_004995659.1 carbamoylphosphate synthase [Salpingoeca rosetta]
MTMKPAKLVLQDGTSFDGFAFGADVSMAGEVVFQTGMVGYPESLTDPSYERQLLCLTYPMIGNYGVPPSDTTDTFGLPAFMESNKVHVAGLIVANLSENHSHWQAAQSLSDWLASQGVPGITGIDTRALTKKLRSAGSMLGKIVAGDTDPDSLAFVDPNKDNLVAAVSIKEPRVFNPDGDVTVVAVDVGLKNNQIRCLASRGARVKLVPYDYDFSQDDDCDGVFLSNGPGDPQMCTPAIESLKKLITRPNNVKPVFGICLGHQLLSIAAGLKTYKMTFGNRGHNQPCTHKHTGMCFITSQNHGFAVDDSDLPEDWDVLFTNENDKTNEGVVHTSKPFFSVQFHPEACAGPQDLEVLFDVFVKACRDKKTTTLLPDISSTLRQRVSAPYDASAFVRPTKVLVLGSGGLSIGQAGEFDYSGSQAIKALKEENIQTVLINANIATVQTMKGLADKVYFLPVTPEYVEKVLEYERPDGVLLAFGGQTALNCGVKLWEAGIFDKYNVKVYGTPVQAIVDTEDREIFSRKLAEISEMCCPNIACTTVEQVLQAAEKIGFPVMMRSSFALGGLGSGVIYAMDELKEKARVALANSTQVMLERSLEGWKEIEYEVVRDCEDNTITVCNMENFDPLGIHTGESIVIAPSQTLNNDEYNMLRSVACKVVRHIGIVGECNIQYALNPHSREYYIVEVNARLSRSSALASKATGYPLAYVAAKLALGHTLPELRNSVTRETTACFEPSLDYCVVKVPRWDLGKFPTVDKRLGTSMKSVGEVMAIGRTFEEAFQKALRMVDMGHVGFDHTVHTEVAEKQLRFASEERPLVIAAALAAGYTVDKLYELTNIDRWFLHRLNNIVQHALTVQQHDMASLPVTALRRAKELGFSDKHIAKLVNGNEVGVRQIRKTHGVLPWVKQIDTVAAEYPAFTNYLYHTYNGSSHDVEFEGDFTMVLGSGVYRIGSSVEFDYCAVGCVRELRRLGRKTIMVNYNPETVSTDYDECDRLYFEELTFETVMDIYDQEDARGIVLAMGGQIPNNIADALHRAQARIFGTSPEMIDNAENRYKFSRMCDTIGVDQPRWKELSSIESAKQFAQEVGYPCLMRPSYILSGTAMRVAHSPADLEQDFKNAVVVSRDYPVVLTKFILDAKEIEIDAIADRGKVLIALLSEHVENAGVHSGDATIVHPPQDLTEKTMNGCREIAAKIAAALHITGPFNIQFIAKDDRLKVIETNVRASRSLPFVSKTAGIDLISLATKVMVGERVYVPEIPEIGHVGVKVPQFSFNRLPSADPTLGVDMISTGEVACFGATREEAYVKAMVATSFMIPKPNGNVLLSIGGYDGKKEFLPSAKALLDLGFKLFGSMGTADYYLTFGVDITPVNWLADSEDVDSIKDDLIAGKYDLIINLPMRNKYRRPASFTTAGYEARRMAVEQKVPLITNIKCAKLFVEALRTCDVSPHAARVDCQASHPTLCLPAPIDCSIDLDEITPEGQSASHAALAGGAPTVLIACEATAVFKTRADIARAKAVLEEHLACDFGLLLHAPPPGADLALLERAHGAAGLIIDFATVHKDLPVSHLHAVMDAFPADRPIVVRATGHELASALLFATMLGRRVHFDRVQTPADVAAVALARDQGYPVSCGAALLDLFPPAPKQDTSDLPPLWDEIDAIDVISSGHGAVLSSGRVSCASALLPLVLTALSNGQLSEEDVRAKLHTNPTRIFAIDVNEDTIVEAVAKEGCMLPKEAAGEYAPFHQAEVSGCVSRVMLHGCVAYIDGKFADNLATVAGPIEVHDVPATRPEPPVTAAATVVRASDVRAPSRERERIGRKRTISTRSSTRELRPVRARVVPAATATSALRGVSVPPAVHTAEDVSLRTRQSVAFANRARCILSVSQFTKRQLHEIFNLAHECLSSGPSDVLKGKVLANIFYEPSTRTSCSFAAAMQRLGGSVVSISDVSTSSVTKGETLTDTVRTLECYADAVVLRHPREGCMEEAASVMRKPLINAGDGTGEHPTQALLDVFTIREELGTVNDLNITLLGDLKHGRTVHSLARLLSHYRVAIRYVAPDSLQIPDKVYDAVGAAGIEQSKHAHLDDVIADTDVLYVTRVQKERFETEAAYEHVRGSYQVTAALMTRAKERMIVMHPLPRVDEISPDVDTDKRAAYFRQMEYGVHVRMALLRLLLEQQ